MRRLVLVISMLTLIAPVASAQLCTGDCQARLEVEFEDLMTMVAHSLNGSGTAACNGGGGENITITAEDIVSAVTNANFGCSRQNLSGTWTQDQVQLELSTCSTQFTDAFRSEFTNVPSCTGQVRVTGPRSIETTDCNRVTSTGTLDETGLGTFIDGPASVTTGDDCTFTIDGVLRVPFAQSPTVGHYQLNAAFSGTCAIPMCRLEIKSRWTKSPNS